MRARSGAAVEAKVDQAENHAEPQEVQRLLRHKTLRITHETYVHWWPKRARRRGVVGGALHAAASRKPTVGQ
ncbi:hypothetical protein [Rhizomonospora bruguierae]|uniref:hypothetical protein n=1 Tax=Rhizomonospora bruguierae TaxID=1581705 RepID=UPI0020BD993A|nr:hypothetical protein [Micromonospora sp. NBRC 107566]